MKEYIKAQSESDKAEASVIGPVLILALVLVAIVWIFGRLMASTSRKGADVANCISKSSSFDTQTEGTQVPNCDNKNSDGHSYDYGDKLDN